MSLTQHFSVGSAITSQRMASKSLQVKQEKMQASVLCSPTRMLYYICTHSTSCELSSVSVGNILGCFLVMGVLHRCMDPGGCVVPCLSSAFSSVPHGGLVILSSTDVATLYGKCPQAMMRNYGAVTTKNDYVKEMAVRILIAAAAR